MRATPNLMFVVLLLAGCTANKMHRPISVQHEDGYALAFIEFDDQGELWDPAQLSRALALIKRANEHERGAAVGLYVHGWQHNASRKSEEKEGGNVHDYKQFLARISDSMELRDGDRAQPLIGIYLGWRGKSGAIPGLNVATFYGRGRTAGRIAGTSATEVIYRILSTAKKNPLAVTILLGHSFGGQILEQAVTQAMVGEVLSEHERARDGLLTDLVVLINPAARSVRAKQFVEMLDRSRIALYRTDSEGRRYEVPLIVSVTSAADFVTRTAYPAGTWIGSLGKKFRKYPVTSCLQFKGQKSFYVRTPGHNQALISHQVTARPLGVGEGLMDLSDPETRIVEAEFDPVSGSEIFSFNGSAHRFTLRRLSGAVNDTPYWIMQVPKEMIPGHSGFFTENIFRLLGAIFEISGALEQDSTTEIVRESGTQPTGIAVMPNGEVLVTDASRRIYEVDASTSTPTFFGCLPPWGDQVGAIGFDFKGETGIGAVSRLTGNAVRGGEDVHETFCFRMTFDGEEAWVSKPIEVRTDLQFTAAAFDVEGERGYLAAVGGKAIYRVDLSKPDAEPVMWFSIETENVVSALHFDQQSGILYAADGTEGAIYQMTDDGQVRTAMKVADNLGWPIGMVIDEQRDRVYVGDAKGQQIWRLDCPQGGVCSPPRPIAKSELFVRPSQLDVAGDGTIWVADLEGGAIVALSPEGEFLQTIRDLPME